MYQIHPNKEILFIHVKLMIDGPDSPFEKQKMYSLNDKDVFEIHQGQLQG